MINPHMLQPKAKRLDNPRFAGGKMYLAVLVPAGLRSRRLFKRASEAEAYAAKLKARWERLYDERIVNMIATPQLGPAAEGEPA